MRTIGRAFPLLLVLIICASCGRSGNNIQEAHSLAEAKSLAAEKGTFIVIDFWRHG
jgi:hypothetical protein